MTHLLSLAQSTAKKKKVGVFSQLAVDCFRLQTYRVMEARLPGQGDGKQGAFYPPVALSWERRPPVLLLASLESSGRRATPVEE